MFKADGFNRKIEPLLVNLSDQPKVDRSRGDLIGPWICLLIGRSTQELFINGVQIPFINYVEDAFRFLGCWLGNVPKVSQELSNCLEKIGSEPNTIYSAHFGGIGFTKSSGAFSKTRRNLRISAGNV
ncbi:hypothetical protein GEMRC1_000790 [Eukaryota sp. GEM-RC1]